MKRSSEVGQTTWIRREPVKHKAEPIGAGAPWLPVTEIFHSIQGESTWTGTPCTFVRLTGCPLRCVWCDTSYSFHGGRQVSLEGILKEVREIGCQVVEITGGEPLAHPNAILLTEELISQDFEVLIETSGSEDVSQIDSRAHLIMDLKCPGSGESERNRWENLEHLDGRDEIKFVISDRNDYEWSRGVIHGKKLTRRVAEGTLNAVLMSPVWGDTGVGLERLADWILEDGLSVRLQTQLHKHIWDPDRRGV